MHNIVGKQLQCPELSAPENGKVHVEGRNPGDRADYSCNDGYQLVGVAWRRCQTNGKWTGEAPTCRSMYKFSVLTQCTRLPKCGITSLNVSVCPC